MNSIQGKRKWEPYVWLLPSILLISIFVVFPILIVFKLSFSEITPGGALSGFGTSPTRSSCPPSRP